MSGPVSINWRPSPRDLQVFAGLQLVFFGCLGSWLWYRWGLEVGPAVLCGVSALLALIGLVFPRFIRPVYCGWMIAMFPIGWLVSHAVLAGVFFGVIWPIGVALRWRGYDPLHRKKANDTRSYWRRREQSPAPEHYFRQF